MLEIQISQVDDPGFTSCTMFHPKAALLPDGRLLMTVQEIHGSDSYGPVLESVSADAGRSWSPPEAIPPLGYRSVGEGVVEGVCDVVPDFDSASGCAVALGHNVYYRDGSFYDTLGSWDRSKSNPALRRRSATVPTTTRPCSADPRDRTRRLIRATADIPTTRSLTETAAVIPPDTARSPRISKRPRTPQDRAAMNRATTTITAAPAQATAVTRAANTAAITPIRLRALRPDSLLPGRNSRRRRGTSPNSSNVCAEVVSTTITDT